MPDFAVDEFCRWFLEGDRRVERTVREQAEIVGHEHLAWQDLPPADVGDRRGQPQAQVPPPAEAHSPLSSWFVRVRRVLGKA